MAVPQCVPSQCSVLSKIEGLISIFYSTGLQELPESQSKYAIIHVNLINTQCKTNVTLVNTL